MNKKLGSYAVVTLSYWSFMLTDGALRMLVLLYFHNLGYSSLTLAFLFLLYEFFGIVTNFFGGWVAQNRGLKFTLILGLSIQPIALIALSFLDRSWAPVIAIPFVMFVQALSGISKDLTKMSSKTAVKFLVPEDQSSKLFSLVSLLTGSKNAIKGFGFFLGGFLLQTIGFKYGLWALSVVVIIALTLSLFMLPRTIGNKKNSKMTLSKMFDIPKNLKILSGARIFLFASRDVWFVVALPVFFSETFGWSHSAVGAFMAIWVIGYGIVQGLSPNIISRWTKGQAPTGKAAVNTSLLLVISMSVIILLFYFNISISISITVGLIIFGIIFAINSSIHSFLVLDYSEENRAASSVGFYYMANAIGRLLGTLLSGLLFQLGGVLYALVGSFLLLVLTYFISKRLTH